MDLNGAIAAAKSGASVREDRLMREGWTVRMDPADKLLYYHRPDGERAHKIVFSDAHRASGMWRICE